MSKQQQLHRINLSRLWQVVCVDGDGKKPIRFDLAEPPVDMPASIERQFNTPTNLDQSVIRIVFSNFPTAAKYQLNGTELHQVAPSTDETFVADVAAMLQADDARSGNLLRVSLPEVSSWPVGMSAYLEIQSS